MIIITINNNKKERVCEKKKKVYFNISIKGEVRNENKWSL